MRKLLFLGVSIIGLSMCYFTNSNCYMKIVQSRESKKINLQRHIKTVQAEINKLEDKTNANSIKTLKKVMGYVQKSANKYIADAEKEISALKTDAEKVISALKKILASHKKAA